MAASSQPKTLLGLTALEIAMHGFLSLREAQLAVEAFGSTLEERHDTAQGLVAPEPKQGA